MYGTFRAAEISLKKTHVDTNKESYHDGITVTTKEYAEDLNKEIINYNERRMRRSKSGVFSITLKLYPGKYEIKFIVNGQWKLDPLRPTVNNNGHQNNLFIFTYFDELMCVCLSTHDSLLLLILIFEYVFCSTLSSFRADSWRLLNYTPSVPKISSSLGMARVLRKIVKCIDSGKKICYTPSVPIKVATFFWARRLRRGLLCFN
ncbi:uncharacterized protein LOC131018078 isoform X2 [Salvia miltiorrhiza]|uniref:uncharacterized protein LOC131018078 isoform X2 n=1 Tax=Salvia miltiorrhiza TaxID=226208 RepID=UPI0025AC43D2|nr:uncharacterized protein LOC131018078 isoform X2 [Salvia miltiorrhiza]